MTFWRGLSVQADVIYALILRESRTRAGRAMLGYLWAYIDPFMWIAAFGVVFHIMGRSAPFGFDIVTFFASGIVPYLLYRQNLSAAQGAYNANRALLVYPQVHPVDLLIARGLLESSTLIFIFWFILAGNTLVIGKEVPINNPLAIIGGLATGALLGTGIGALVAFSIPFIPILERIVPILTRPLFWISGVFFTLNELPTHLHGYILWNPILHVVETVRGGLVPAVRNDAINLAYPLLFGLAAWAVALAIMPLARRRLEF